MNALSYTDVLQEAEKLPADQCLLLIERLIHHVRTVETKPEVPLAWEDYAGSAPYPLCGEDAQEWISHGRMLSDVARDVI